MSRKLKLIVWIVLILASLAAAFSRLTSKALANPGQGAMIVRGDGQDWGFRIDDSGQYLWVNGFDPRISCMDPLFVNHGNFQVIILPQPADIQRLIISSKGDIEYTMLYDAAGWNPVGDEWTYFCGFVAGKNPLAIGVLKGDFHSNDLSAVGKVRWAHSRLEGEVVDQTTGETRHLLILNQWVWDPTGALDQSIRIFLH